MGFLGNFAPSVVTRRWRRDTRASCLCSWPSFMNAGAGGFAGAPVTKFILASSVTSSVILQAAHGLQRRVLSPYLHFLSQSFVFRHPGELACGTLLLYYFRLLERQRGSAKHGACVASTLAISYTLQSAVSTALSLVLPSGPYGLIFANFVPFVLDIPPAQNFTLFGLPMTDKASTPLQSDPPQPDEPSLLRHVHNSSCMHSLHHC